METSLALCAEEELSIPEAVKLGAADSIFYSHYFFPKTFRSKSPQFMRQSWAGMENAQHRYYGTMNFRDSAKTTRGRVFASKRIAYGLSRTILFVGKGLDAALHDIDWIKRAVEFNHLWSNTFNLVKGSKWAGEEVEIIHRIEGYSIRLLAFGMTGQVRGVNIDDHRPDLIIVNDPCDEENTSTPEQRKKTEKLFFGSIVRSLVSPAENPGAKVVLNQTVLNRDDLISVCSRDPSWHVDKFSCFDDAGHSVWPERYPTEFLQKEKAAYINRNQLSLWLMEMECKVISPETSDFRDTWLKYWDVLPPLNEMVTFMAIDPVPPPSDVQIANGLKDKDFEVLAVIGIHKGKYYLCDYAFSRGHDPDWTVMKFFELLDTWRCLRVRVETTAYQRTLKWLLEKAMQARRRYVQINAGTPDRKRAKRYRIVDAFSGIASQGLLYVNKEKHKEFIQQFIEAPDLSHDDILEAVAEAISEAKSSPFIEGSYENLGKKEDALPTTWQLVQ